MLTAFGNPYLGKALIDMGVSDIFFVMRSIVNNDNCEWGDYLKDKAVSTAIALISAGIDKIKDAREAAKAAKAAKQTAAGTAVAGQGARSAAGQAAQSAAGQTMTSQVSSQVMNSVRTALYHELGNFALSAASRGILSNYKDDIKNNLRRTLLGYFNESNYIQQVDKLLSVDACVGNGVQAENLQRLAFQILERKQSTLLRMGKAIMDGVIARQNAVAGMIIKGFDIGSAVAEITSLCEKFCDDHRERLPSLVRKSLTHPGLSQALTLDHSAIRGELQEHIITQITQIVMSALQHEVVAPSLGVFRDVVGMAAASALAPKPEGNPVDERADASQRAELDSTKMTMITLGLDGTAKGPRTENAAAVYNAKIVSDAMTAASSARAASRKSPPKAPPKHSAEPEYRKYTFHEDASRQQTVFSFEPQPNSTPLKKQVVTSTQKPPANASLKARLDSPLANQSVGDIVSGYAQERGLFFRPFPPARAETPALPIEGTESKARLNIGDRAMGAVKCVFGVLEVGVGAFGGVVTAPSGIGPVAGALLATNGVDNAVAGSLAVVTGKPHSTLLNQSLRSTGLSSTTADVAEVVIGLSPAAMPAVARLGNKAVASAQRARTEYQLRDRFFGPATAHHATGSAATAQSVLSGIDPNHLNPNGRFRAAYYLAENPETARLEL